MDFLGNKEIIKNDQFLYRGVVENNKDPEKLGRCQVRVLGVHSDNNKDEGNGKGVPDKNLPWAELIGSTDYIGGNSSIGASGVPIQGTWVWVYFDGDDFTRPVILGYCRKKNEPRITDSTKGFKDKDMVYPLDEHTGESTINRVARNEKLNETAIGVKKSNLVKGISIASGGTWNEPDVASYNSVYPHNRVIMTETGNIIEYDDTPGNSRLHFLHNTGSYFEILNNGTTIIKSIGDKYDITKGSRLSKVSGSDSTTISSNKALLVGGNSEEVIKGNRVQTIKGNLDVKVSGQGIQKYSGGLKIDAGPTLKVNAGIILLN